jgi:UDP-N-acetylglucosamine 2-epimerase (non-hydrolysing)
MEEQSVAVVFGTRPEVVKLAPVLWALGPAALTVHTGQHYDPELAAALLDEVGLGPPAVQLRTGPAPRGAQLAAAVGELDRLLAERRPAAVVVQGDTTSTLAGALAANVRAVPLVHVEAGLRSYDRSMPEEHHRVVADHLADRCCTPTETGRARLAAEGIAGERVVVTGNTVVDAANRLLPDPAVRRARLERLGLTPNGFVVATFHRPENVDDAATLQAILAELASLPLPVLLPLHPRTARRAEEAGALPVGGPVRVVRPLGYADFLGVAAECAFLVSDSGGVQEEASIVKRPVLVVRRSTERPEVLGTFAELVAPGPGVGTRAREWAATLPGLHARLAPLPTPFGDGRAGERTAEVVARLVEHR